MQRWIPWFILGLICLVILLAYRKYATISSLAYVVPEPESFSAPPPPIRGTLRGCRVYYTSNVDICDRPTALTITEADIDADTVNYYQIGSNEVRSHIDRLEAIPSSNLTPTQSSSLENLKRVLVDINTLPFKNTCQLELSGMKESSAHPRKILQDYDGTNRRGDPLHWAFCYYNTQAPPIGDRIPQSVLDATPFQRVFKDTTVDYRYNTDAYRRYDMKSVYNDDLLNLHCALYTNKILEGGSSASAFNNTVMMEFSLRESDVNALATATGTAPLTILRMRPVRIQGGLLVAETNPTVIRASYLRFIEIVRTQTALIHRPKTFNPTLYKLLFHLCSADPQYVNAVAPGAAPPSLISNKYIELMVPKPLNQPVSQILQFTPTYAQTQTQLYDFYAQPPNGDISDMVLTMENIDQWTTRE